MTLKVNERGEYLLTNVVIGLFSVNYEIKLWMDMSDDHLNLLTLVWIYPPIMAN